MKPPCMIVVQYILPAIRAAVARELVEVHGLKKSNVAEIMGLTPAAITQYLNTSRGDNVDLLEGSDRFSELVSELAEKLAGGEYAPDLIILQMCRICSLIRSQGLICELHMEEMPQLRDALPCACGIGLIETKGTI
jgi:predicted transcriptional regulator